MSQNKNSHLWSQFVRQLREGVKPAVGCTEPISLALATAKATALLGEPVVRVEAWVSPNLMKNGMGVTVPGTGMAGLPIAAALGATGGDPEAGLEVLLKASAEAIAQAKTLVSGGCVTVGVKAPVKMSCIQKLKCMASLVMPLSVSPESIHTLFVVNVMVTLFLRKIKTHLPITVNVLMKNLLLMCVPKISITSHLMCQ